MIHVGTDKRRLRSAELLLNALVKLMNEKDFSEISISDLQKESGVSRATFYRLFDTTIDILDYKCRQIAADISNYYEETPAEKRECFLLFSLRYWLKQHVFLEAIFNSNRSDILQNALRENSDFLKDQFPAEMFLQDSMDYLMSCSLGILSNLLLTWVSHGQKESPEELFAIFHEFSGIVEMFFQ